MSRKIVILRSAVRDEGSQPLRLGANLSDFLDLPTVIALTTCWRVPHPLRAVCAKGGL